MNCCSADGRGAFTAPGGNGGSGVVIISYPAAFKSATTTGIISQDHWYHTS